MKKLILLALILLPIAALSQTVTNVRFEQKGDRVYIYYHLDKEANIDIHISMEGNNSTNSFAFRQLSDSELEGDFGANVKAGNKLVIWDALKDNESVVGNNVYFKVVPNESSNAFSKRMKDNNRRYRQLTRSYKRSAWLSNYYQANGRLQMNWFGYGIGIGSCVMFDLNAFSFRWRLLEVQPANFKLCLDWDGEFFWSYQPSLRVYIPFKNPYWSFYFDAGYSMWYDPHWGVISGYKIENGVHWGAEGWALNGDFYIRCNGGFTVGLTMGFASHWKKH